MCGRGYTKSEIFLRETSAEMPWEKEVSEIEVQSVWFLHRTGMQICHNATDILKPKAAEDKVIKCGIDDSVQKRSGTKSKLFHRDWTCIIHLATTKKCLLLKLPASLEKFSCQQSNMFLQLWFH